MFDILRLLGSFSVYPACQILLRDGRISSAQSEQKSSDTQAQPGRNILKDLHLDVDIVQQAKTLSDKLDNLLREVGDIAVFFSDAERPGVFAIPNAIQKAFRPNPLSNDLKYEFEEKGLNPDEYLNMAFSPTHTGLVIKSLPTSDNPTGLLFIHLDMRSQKPTKENLSPFNGELKVDTIVKAMERAANFRSKFEVFKIGHIENMENFLIELQEIKDNIYYYVPTLLVKGIQLLVNEKFGLSTSWLRRQGSHKTNLVHRELGKKTAQNIPAKFVCSDLVAYLVLSKVELDEILQSIRSELEGIASRATPTNLWSNT
jgi:hypothetical protein